MTRIEELVKKVHKAKGRYHTQLAMCDLYDVCGLPNFRPGSEPVQPEQEPVAWRYPRDYGHWDLRYWLNRPSEGHRVGEEPLYTAAPQRQPLTGEQDRALCEAYCNDASDEYFKARPALDFPEMRRIFYAGHRKAWITREAAHEIGEKT
jgi:hypothetical protein